MIQIQDTTFGDDIPRYTKDDEARLVKEHAGIRMHESMTFADLYSMRTASALVPLEEHIFKRWHYQRIITLGDSVHKVRLRAGNSKDVC